MKILVVNQPIGNRGDESAHKAFVNALRNKKNMEITILFYGTKERHSDEAIEAFVASNSKTPNVIYIKCRTGWISSRLPYRSFFMPSLACKILEICSPAVQKLKAMIKSSDLVVCAPGGVCMGTYKSWSHIWLLHTALRFGKKVAIYSRSFGPFSEESEIDNKFKSVSVNILKKASFLSIRDNQSQKYAKELGIDFVEAIDTAFLEKPAKDIPKEYSLLKDKEYVVFVPNELNAWHPSFKNVESKNFEHFYKSIIDYLIAKGLHVVMLPQTCIPANRLDYLYLKKLASSYQDNVTVVTDDFHSDDQQAIIRFAKMVVGARYHSIVFAINNSVPFVSLSYEHKMSGMLDVLHLSDMCYGLKEKGIDDAEEVKSMIETILSSQNEFILRINNASHAAHKLAENCFSEFMDFIKVIDDKNCN